jgi:rod shape-determining protein MreC
VVNESGVLGQVTRAFPLSSEVTLLADKDAAIPVLNLRTQQRSAAFGGREGGMELRFLPANADVQVGDLLHTSGLDGVYPPGLPVGTVERVERRAEAGFARVAVRLAAQADGVRHVLVLEPMAAQLPPAVAATAGASSAAAEGASPAAAPAPAARRHPEAPRK